MSDGFTLTPLQRIEARLVPYNWAWARDEAAAIAETWARRRAERSDLFDGRVLLARDCRVDGSICRIDLFEVAYSEFLAFRLAGSPDPAVENAFAAVVPWSADGAALLGIMGGHTANAGQIYFACGTPDRADIRDRGRVDLAGSAELAARRQAATTESNYQSTLLARASDAYSSATGVNTDDETAATLALEQSYTASAKLLTLVNDLLKTLMDAVR